MAAGKTCFLSVARSISSSSTAVRGTRPGPRDLLAPGGLLVKDDLTPGRQIAGDPVREAFLNDERLMAVEMLVTADMAVIVAARHP